MKIVLKDLYDESKTFDERAEANDVAERYAAAAAGFDISDLRLTEGYAPEYDFIMLTSGTTVEVKYHGIVRSFTNCRYPIKIETHHNSGKPSAICLSKADYYLMITPGWSTQGNRIVGKVRAIRRSELLSALLTGYGVIERTRTHTFIDPRKIHDGWVKDVEVVMEEGKVVAYII
jgi:hypothetical protein